MVRRLSFGPFTLDFDTRELLRDSDRRRVHLSPKAYELLSVLIERRPKAIAKADLHEQLWPSTFVSEATRAGLVKELRGALEERGRDARFIRTVHGFGYAFSGEARGVGGPDPVRITNWIICGDREHAVDQCQRAIGRGGDGARTLSSPTVS